EPGKDVRLQKLVDEPGVKVQAFLVNEPVPRFYPGPTCGEAVGLKSKAFHQRDVFGHPVVMVDGDFRGVSPGDRERFSRIHVPDRVFLASSVGGSFDLGRGRRRSPKEPFRETLRQFSLCHQPFTAPAMIPETSCFPATTNTSSRGSVARTAPART